MKIGKNFRKNLKGNLGIIQFTTVGFIEILAWVNSVIFTSSSAAFLFCGFHEVLGFIIYFHVSSNFVLLPTLSNWQFDVNWLKIFNFSQNFQTVNKSPDLLVGFGIF